MGVYEYAVVRKKSKDPTEEDNIAVYIIQGWTFFRVQPYSVNKYGESVWPQRLENFKGYTSDYNLKLTVQEASKVARELKLYRVGQINESYFDTSATFVDMTK